MKKILILCMFLFLGCGQPDSSGGYGSTSFEETIIYLDPIPTPTPEPSPSPTPEVI